MSGLGFTRDDFRIFMTQGFSARMEQVLGRLQPKLDRLGREMAPELERVMRIKMFPHVARHAHQSPTPPHESWVAWGPSPRGYTRSGYLALCVSGSGIHARAAVKAQAKNRAEMSRKVAAAAGELARSFGNTRLARYEDPQPGGLAPAQPADRALFDSLAGALATGTGAIDVGFGWPIRDALRLERADVIDAFRELEPLYRILHGNH